MHWVDFYWLKTWEIIFDVLKFEVTGSTLH